MKKIILCLTAVVFAAGLFAQNAGKAKKTPEEVATKRADKLKSELALSDEQRSKVYAILLDNTTKIRAVQAKYPNDKKAARAEIKPLREACDTSIKGVLTADQISKYEKMKADHKASRKDKKNQKQPGDAGH